MESAVPMKKTQSLNLEPQTVGKAKLQQLADKSDMFPFRCGLKPFIELCRSNPVQDYIQVPL